MEAREYCRMFENYARSYQAGAFATPMKEDMEKAIKEDRLHIWGKKDAPDYVGFEVKAHRDLHRKDFTGSVYHIKAGASILQFLARVKPAAKLPSLKKFDVVYAYQEDTPITAELRNQGFGRQWVKISASSELVGIYTKDPEVAYPEYDEATLEEVPVKIPVKLREAIVKEVEAIEGWRDDYPYYNKDGSWAQVSLRGYNPDDPFWGVKPAEMSKKWKEEHPEEAKLTECDWTVICKKMPATMELLQSVPWWSQYERIRLLQMYSRSGGEGKLLRHTDITDRQAGTKDGELSRFHLPIMSHPDARTYGWNLEGEEIVMNLKPWKCYYLDQRKPHMVTVPAGVNRIHLVPDVITDEKVRAKIF